MNRWLLAAAAAVFFAVAVAGWWLHGDAVAPVATPPRTAATPAASAPQVVPALPPGGVVAPPVPTGQDTPLLPLPAEAADAARTMNEAREHGDTRAPAVVRSPEREAPTAAELADPEAYRRYEARQNQRLYSDYVKAADNAIPQLQQDIDRARREGLPEEEIRKGEEKLRRIQAMRDQLSADHPDIAPASAGTP